jgi:hypothetical protein
MFSSFRIDNYFSTSKKHFLQGIMHLGLARLQKKNKEKVG